MNKVTYRSLIFVCLYLYNSSCAHNKRVFLSNVNQIGFSIIASLITYCGINLLINKKKEQPIKSTKKIFFYSDYLISRVYTYNDTNVWNWAKNEENILNIIFEDCKDYYDKYYIFVENNIKDQSILNRLRMYEVIQEKPNIKFKITDSDDTLSTIEFAKEIQCKQFCVIPKEGFDKNNKKMLLEKVKEAMNELKEEESCFNRMWYAYILKQNAYIEYEKKVSILRSLFSVGAALGAGGLVWWLHVKHKAK